MRVLVTGGSGFIGSHVVDALVEAGHEVQVIDLWVSPAIQRHIENQRIWFREASILDAAAVDEVMNDSEVVIHLASILGTSETIEQFDPVDVLNVNILGTVQLLRSARRLEVERFVYPSTPDVPWLNPYKISKLATERLCQMYCREYGLSTVVLRLNNVYGPRERTPLLQSSSAYNYEKVIPTFIVAALQNQPLYIYGSGHQIGDYVFIEDVVEAFRRAIVNTQIEGTIIPIGTGIGTSVLELSELIIHKTDSKSEIRHRSMRRGEIELEISTNTDIARDLLGFEAKVSLEDGLEKTIPYYVSELRNSREAED